MQARQFGVSNCLCRRRKQVSASPRKHFLPVGQALGLQISHSQFKSTRGNIPSPKRINASEHVVSEKDGNNAQQNYCRLKNTVCTSNSPRLSTRFKGISPQKCYTFQSLGSLRTITFPKRGAKDVSGPVISLPKNAKPSTAKRACKTQWVALLKSGTRSTAS